MPLLLLLLVVCGSLPKLASARASREPALLTSFPQPRSHAQPRQVELPNEDLEAIGCFLEFLYTGDYFPKKVPGQRALEKDASIPDVDMTGEQLLKHAKVYTLAEKFGLTLLKNLASSKIHCVNSTAKGEIAYARYIYEYTSKEDTSIRAPVANFWATRSHTLRAEAEAEFRDLCLEFPQFGYDVLSTLSLVTRPGCSTCLACFVPPHHRMLTSLSFSLSSSRSRREAQARAQRQTTPGYQQLAQAAPSQHWRQRLGGQEGSPRHTRGDTQPHAAQTHAARPERHPFEFSWRQGKCAGSGRRGQPPNPGPYCVISPSSPTPMHAMPSPTRLFPFFFAPFRFTNGF